MRIGCLLSTLCLLSLTTWASAASVVLNWNAASDNSGIIQSYQIERATGVASTNFSLIHTTPGSTLTYTDLGLANDTTFRYRLRAVDPSNNLSLLYSTIADATTPPTAATLILSITASGKFALNGVPVFLAGVGYYDCPNYHTSDLDTLATAGWNFLVCHADDVLRNNANSLYNADGSTKAAKVTAIRAFNDYAETKGMAVSINCLYADIDGTNSAAWLTTAAARTAAVTNCINAFKDQTNVMFSVVNEHNYGSFADAESEMQALMSTARAACASCIIYYSSSENIGADSVAHLFTTRSGDVVDTAAVLAEYNNGITVLAVHNDRQSGWNTKTIGRASNLRTYLNNIGATATPVLFEEDGAENNLYTTTTAPLGSAAAYIQVAQDCKLGNCAGWVYTPDASFDLNPSTLLSQVTAVETTLFSTLPAALSGTGTTTRAAASFTDNFNRANGALGANWDDGYTGISSLTINTNRIRSTSTVQDNAETYNGTTPSNHWASVELPTWTGSDLLIADVMVRFAAPATFSGYICRAIGNDNVFGGHTTQIARWDAGSYTILANLTTSAWAAGDKLLCDAVGSTITLSRVRSAVETTLLSVTDSAYASGRTGLNIYAATLGNVEMDNFEMGGFTTSSYVKPTITALTTDPQGLTLTCAGSCASVRIQTDLGSVIYSLGSLPGGRLDRTWAQTETFACAFAIDDVGVESNVDPDYQCRPITVSGTDTTAPFIVTFSPVLDTEFPAGTTSVNAFVQTNEAATCKYDTTDVVFGTMASTFTTTNFITHAFIDSGLTNGASRTIYFNCIDSAGNLAAANHQLRYTVAGAGGDTTLPSTVTNVAAQPLSSTQLRFTWTAATDNVAVGSYILYQCLDLNCTSTSIAALPIGSPFILNNLTTLVTYNFAIKAVDTSGNVSASFSNILTVQMPNNDDTKQPNDVITLYAIGQAYNRVSLIWSSSYDEFGIAGYAVERCADRAPCKTFVGIGFTKDTTFTDITATPGATYTYRVIPIDTNGNSASNYSPQFQVTVPVTKPPIPGWGPALCDCGGGQGNAASN